MSGYQIDEVRELFTSDMNRFMSDLVTRAGELRDELAVIRQRTQAIERAHSALTVNFHAIAGTSSLLSVASSHSLAAHLENMMYRVDASVRSVMMEGDRLDHYRQACDLGITALREIIDDELRGDRANAERRSAEALAQVKRAADPPALAIVTARDVSSHASTSGSDSASASATADQERTELLAVFREELRGAMTEAKANLDQLEHGPDRGVALARLGSVLHMMKGSAASVGEAALAIELRSLYEVIEDFLDRGELPERAATHRIRRELMACEPEVPPAAVNPGGSHREQDDGDDAIDPQELFRTEAHELLRQARGRFEEFGREPVAVREDLGRIFHRIKGSAMVVDLPEIGAVAAELERTAGQLGPLDATQLDRLAALIAAAPSAAQVPATPAPERARATREPVPHVVTGELWESFAEESAELLEAIERGARELERTSNLGATVTSLLGAFHTLKGAANTVGLDPVGRELHVVETMLESLNAAPSPKRRSFVLTRLFDVVERMRRNLRLAPRGEVECAAEVLEQDLERMANLEVHSIETPSGHSWLSTHDSAWSEHHRGSTSAGAGGSSREHSSDHQRVDRTGPDSSRTGAPAGVERRFIRVPAERLDALMDMVGELIVTRSRVNAGLSALAALHEEQEQRRQRLVQIVDVFTEQAEYANLGGVARRNRRAGGSGAVTDFGALEFDVYEEVHVLARRLAEASSDVNDTSAEISSGMAQLTDSTEELGGIVSTLQSNINRARMVPLEALFSRLALPVRDAAERERKLVDISLQGAEVVIDKAIADALYAPLLHLVRNSVAHGIESASRRHAASKPERGTVTLTARQEAGEIVIEVSDDGGGINVQALHREGVARGLLSRDVPLDAPEVLDLVFSAGLSTTADTNEVAGRGMGGDVVRRTVQRLGGSVRVFSPPGRGASFVLRLPVTLAITRAVVIRQGQQLFGIPLLFIERIVRREDLQELHDGERRRIRHGGDLLSVFRIAPGENAESVFLICSVGGRRLAIEADEVVAQDEVVVKSLGQVLDGHPLFAGASQRGDGELALIIDMHGVAEAHTGVARPIASRSASGSPRQLQSAPTPPAAPLSPHLDPPVAADTQPVGPQRLRVLFVDDSLSVRKVAENTLRKLGVEVVTASDGRDALDRLRDGEVSIVFTDLEMPRMHGYELIQEMRYIPAYRSIPIVVVSSRSGEKHVQKALEAGANEYLTKPFSAETLSGALLKLIPTFRIEDS
jgi:chemosensory pili system protein ChpA (sensor histidine kinase/response regulator)